jgi:hypothetical protein
MEGCKDGQMEGWRGKQLRDGGWRDGDGGMEGDGRTEGWRERKAEETEKYHFVLLDVPSPSQEQQLHPAFQICHEGFVLFQLLDVIYKFLETVSGAKGEGGHKQKVKKMPVILEKAQKKQKRKRATNPRYIKEEKDQKQRKRGAPTIKERVATCLGTQCTLILGLTSRQWGTSTNPDEGFEKVKER